MINLALSQEQHGIAASARDFLTHELPVGRLRELAGQPEQDALDEPTWQRCAELGWLGLSLPESSGGVGMGLADEAVLFREVGRGLAPGPLRSGVLGARVASVAGDTDLAVAIASGERRVGLQIGELAIDTRPGDLLLVLGHSTGVLREVSSVERVRGVDPGTRFVRATPGPVVVEVDDALLLSRARILAAAELLGIIEAVRDMSAEYARIRVQFDKPIGTFQAVKHRCADMAIAAYAATGQVFQAALLVDAGAPDAGFHAAAAYVLASRGARTSTADNIMNHGGTGFTWEHDAHRYLKRAFLLEQLLGPQRSTYQAVLEPRRHEFYAVDAAPPTDTTT